MLTPSSSPTNEFVVFLLYFFHHLFRLCATSLAVRTVFIPSKNVEMSALNAILYGSCAVVWPDTGRPINVILMYTCNFASVDVLIKYLQLELVLILKNNAVCNV